MSQVQSVDCASKTSLDMLTTQLEDIKVENDRPQGLVNEKDKKIEELESLNAKLVNAEESMKNRVALTQLQIETMTKQFETEMIMLDNINSSVKEENVSLQMKLNTIGAEVKMTKTMKQMFDTMAKSTAKQSSSLAGIQIQLDLLRKEFRTNGVEVKVQEDLNDAQVNQSDEINSPLPANIETTTSESYVRDADDAVGLRDADKIEKVPEKKRKTVTFQPYPSDKRTVLKGKTLLDHILNTKKSYDRVQRCWRLDGLKDLHRLLNKKNFVFEQESERRFDKTFDEVKKSTIYKIYISWNETTSPEVVVYDMVQITKRAFEEIFECDVQENFCQEMKEALYRMN